NILAHGQLVTTDMIATLFIFAACWALWHYLTVRRKAWLVGASIFAGLAMAAKLSCILLIPVFGLALWWDARRSAAADNTPSGALWKTFRIALHRGGLGACAAFVTIWLVYGLETGPVFQADRRHPTFDKLVAPGRLRTAASY